MYACTVSCLEKLAFSQVGKTRDRGGQETDEQKTGSRGTKYRNSGIEPQKGDTGTVDRGLGTEKGEWETEDRSRET